MPTPFQHLVYADRIYQSLSLPPSLREALSAARGAYLLGSTAADVQAVTGQARVETHFYRLNDAGKHSAVARLLASYPALADPSMMSSDRAAFVSGYLVHLVWDEIWARDIFLPFYRDAEHWPDRLSYFVHHNALRVLLDRSAYRSLRDHADLPVLLGGAVPDRWLPFATDGALLEWRDWLIEQLVDPSAIRTAEVFAMRMHVPVRDLEAIVAEMTGGRYEPGVDLAKALRHYESVALKASLETLLRYWRIEDRLSLVCKVSAGHIARR
ncbi:MAG: zinc dependent phospholipase C family protein [Anaerolineae bacterium]